MINTWGFYNFMAPYGILILWLLLLVFSCSRQNDQKEECLLVLATFLFGCLAISYVIHFITMAVMRLRHAGRVCSGDFDIDFPLFRLGVQKQPYQYLTGTWLFYSLATQFYSIIVFITGFSFVVGTMQN